MPLHLQGPHMARGVRWDRLPPLYQAVFVSADLSETRGRGPLPAGAQRRLKDDVLTELGLEMKVWREQEEKVEEPGRRPHRKHPGVGKGAGPVLVWKGSGTTWEWEMTSEDFFKKISTVLAEVFFKRKEWMLRASEELEYLCLYYNAYHLIFILYIYSHYIYMTW